MPAELVCTVAASGFEAWKKLAGSWRELECAAEPAFFTTYDWLDAYWRTQGVRHEPYILAVHDAVGRLVGFAPFEKVHRRLVPRTGIRITTLRFPCRREREGLEFLARSGSEDLVAEAIARDLRHNRADWHEILATDAPRDGAVVCAIRSQFDRDDRNDVHLIERPPTPIVQLSGSWETYLAGMRRSMRKDAHRGSRRLDELGGRFRALELPEDIHRALAFFFEMKNARLREVADGSVYERAEVRDFLRAGVDVLHASKRLSCVALEIEGNLAAVGISFLVGTRMWGFGNAFDPRWSSLGLGVRIIEQKIQHGFAVGATELNLGQGDADYKVRYASDLRANVDLLVQRRWVTRASTMISRIKHVAGRTLDDVR